MKRVFITFSILFSLSLSMYSQDNPPTDTPSTEEVQQGVNKLQNQVKSLFEYYEKYDGDTSKKEKKNALDKAIDDMAGEGNVSEKDKSDAFKVIDAYIDADESPTQNKPEKTQINFEDRPEVQEKAQEYFDGAKNHLLSMSYTEYEKSIWAANPMLSRREIKESYNQLHKNDGRAVPITASDDELTDTQKQVNAFNQMQNAKTYQEYKEAINILNPSVSDKEIRKAWENR